MAKTDEIHAIDIQFKRACKRAADILKSKRSRDDRVRETSDLVQILRSLDRIGPGEIEELAKLILGDLDNPRQRPERNATEKEKLRRLVELINQRQASELLKGRRISRTDAAKEVAESEGFDPEKLVNYISQSNAKRTGILNRKKPPIYSDPNRK